MSKAAIRSKKYAKAIRLGVQVGQKHALEFGKHPTEYAFMSDISEVYNLFSEPRLFDMARQSASIAWHKEMRNLRDNVWSEEEYAERLEKSEFLNMDMEERQDYLLRQEVGKLRVEVQDLKKLVGAAK